MESVKYKLMGGAMAALILVCALAASVLEAEEGPARIHQHNAPVVFQGKTGVVTGGCQCVSGFQYDQSLQRTFLTDRRWNRWAVCLKKVRLYRIDTANVEEIRRANDMGVIAGVTTNPSPASS